MRFLIYLCCIQAIIFAEEVLFPDCVSIAGSYATYPDVSEAKCPSNYSLVGCNTISADNDQLYGSYVQHNICKSTGGSRSYVIARCCLLPECSTCTHKTMSGDGLAISECLNDAILTGCTASVNNITKNSALEVGAAGNAQAFSQTSGEETVTNNTCTGLGYLTNTNTSYLKSTASCCVVPNNYELKCIAIWRYSPATTNGDDVFTCPSQYFMTSCVARNEYQNANDFWYVTNGSECRTQMDSWQSKYAQAICCKLIKKSDDNCYATTLNPASNTHGTGEHSTMYSIVSTLLDDGSMYQQSNMDHESKMIIMALFIAFFCCSVIVFCLLCFAKYQQNKKQKILCEYNDRIENGYAELVDMENENNDNSFEGKILPVRNENGNDIEDEDDDIYKYSAPTVKDEDSSEGDLETQIMTGDQNKELSVNDNKRDNESLTEMSTAGSFAQILNDNVVGTDIIMSDIINDIETDK